jgi:UMF1 family MFS transporter
MFGFAESVSAIRASFVAVALWWAAFSIPLFLRVPEPPADATGDGASAIGAAFSRLGRTFREIRRYRHAFLLFIAMLLYQDGIQTVIRMSSVYGAEVGIEQTMQIAAFVMVQFVGIPCAFLFGALGTRFGTKTMLFVAIAIYIVAASLAYFMTSVVHFFLLAFLVATVLGGSQALSRALFARLIPQDRTSEFFGFYAVSERFATVFGPALFTISALVTGSSRSAILAFVLSFVNEEEGTRAARA